MVLSFDKEYLHNNTNDRELDP